MYHFYIYRSYDVVFSLITRTLGAKSVTIAEETERLRQLEAAVFNDFRRDIRKKLRMQGVKVCMYGCLYMCVCLVCLSVCVSVVVSPSFFEVLEAVYNG